MLSSSIAKTDGLYASEYSFTKGNSHFSTVCLHRVLKIWGDVQLKGLLCQHEALNQDPQFPLKSWIWWHASLTYKAGAEAGAGQSQGPPWSSVVSQPG